MHIQFAELPVFDQSRARDFYANHLGCEVIADVPMGADGWRWLELRFPNAQTTLHFVHRADDQPSKEPVLVLIERDVPATVARLRSEGVTILSGPAPAPYDPSRLAAEFLDS